MSSDMPVLRVFILGLILLLGSCGPGEDTGRKNSQDQPDGIQEGTGRKIVLAASEQVPYIGENLLDGGYVHELVRAAFRRVGYDARIQFFPPARMHYLAEHGSVDAILPLHFDAALESTYAYSTPFPGDNIGLLKQRGSLPELKSGKMLELKRVLKKFKRYRFGAVRGASTMPAFDQAANLKKDYASSDLQNLEKLIRGRIDLALIDKYTVADLTVGKRPHYIGQFEFLSLKGGKRPFHLGFPRKKAGYDKVRADFNRGLKELEESGELDKILNRHGIYMGRARTPGKTRIVIATVNNSDMLLMQQLSVLFEKENPDIKLEWRVMEEGLLSKRLLSDISIADGQFDILTIGSYEAPIWAARGWLAPIKRLPARFDVKDIIAPIRRTLSHKGQLYALPFYGESVMTYYRKDLFKAAGIQMPAQPTFADITSFAKKLHNPNAGVYGLCMRGKLGWGENMAIVTSLVHAFGGRWFDEKWVPQMDTRPWRDALSFYIQGIQKFGPPQAQNNGFNENLKLFSEGKCAIWFDATVAAGLLFDSNRSKIHKHLGFALGPRSAQGAMDWLWAWALAVPYSSRHKVKALRFIRWATSKNYIKLVAQKKGWVAVPPGTRVSTYKSPKYQAAAPFAGPVLKAINSAKPLGPSPLPTPYQGLQFVGIPEFTSLGTQIGVEVRRAVIGQISQEEALRRAQSLATEQMRSSGYTK